jgi:hypothetical protein
VEKERTRRLFLWPVKKIQQSHAIKGPLLVLEAALNPKGMLPPRQLAAAAAVHVQVLPPALPRSSGRDQYQGNLEKLK